MEKQTLKAICDNIDVWENWRVNYGKYVPLFIKEAATGAHWSAWDEDVFREYFMSTSGQCVSSLRQGYFTHSERDAIKEHWNEIAPLLQKIAQQQDEPQYVVYKDLKDKIREYTGYDRRAATNRLIAGLQPQLLSTIVNQNKLWDLFMQLSIHIAGFDLEWKPTWFENSYQVLQLFKKALNTDDGYQVMTYPWQVYEEYDFANNDNTPDNDMSETKTAEITALLMYKKQIILQGPPGTGKTRLAEEIARTLTHVKAVKVFTKDDIIANCRQQASIPAAKTQLRFKILGVNESGVRVENSEGKEHTAQFDEIVKMYENKAWEKEGMIINGTHSYSAAVAKFLHSKLDGTSPSKNDYYKIIQFHPSYTYEDFVRGIVAKPNPDGEGIIYEPENKVLAKFAKEALENYKNVQISEAVHVPVEVQAKSKLDRFITHVIEMIDKEGKYQISDNVYIFYVDNKRFKYKGDKWEAHPKGLNMNFSELEKIIASDISERADIVKLHTLNALTRSHATYYANVMEKFNEFSPDNVMPEQKKIPLKNYVLIIDEINRANLSSVLGELIYALEYRGKPVESMYEIDGEQRLILPPNFYIIGTMNTADRSVGHIDYAIRRRFAFVDVLPEVLEEDEEIYFNTSYFAKVAALFNRNNVSPEFEMKDVQIGHSYFIVKKEDAQSVVERDKLFRIKMEYEVVPILNEYVKDGVLVGKIDGKDIKDYVNELKSVVS